MLVSGLGVSLSPSKSVKTWFRFKNHLPNLISNMIIFSHEDEFNRVQGLSLSTASLV